MTPEYQPKIMEMIKSRMEIEDSAKTEIVVEGELSLLDGRNDLLIVLSELLNNCLEKEGVTTVKIIIGKGRLVVEDDVVHDDAEATVSKLNSGGPLETTKGDFHGGGIWGTTIILEKYGGKLEYLAEGGKITAIATWVD